MKRKRMCFFVFLGFFLVPMSSSLQADEGREVTLVSRVEQGAKIWSPSTVEAKEGETITIRLENKTEVMHGFTIEELGIKEQVMGGMSHEIKITLKKKGTFRYFCHFHTGHKGGELKVQ